MNTPGHMKKSGYIFLGLTEQGRDYWKGSCWNLERVKSDLQAIDLSRDNDPAGRVPGGIF